MIAHRIWLGATGVAYGTDLIMQDEIRLGPRRIGWYLPPDITKWLAIDAPRIWWVI